MNQDVVSSSLSFLKNSQFSNVIWFFRVKRDCLSELENLLRDIKYKPLNEYIFLHVLYIKLVKYLQKTAFMFHLHRQFQILHSNLHFHFLHDHYNSRNLCTLNFPIYKNRSLFCILSYILHLASSIIASGTEDLSINSAHIFPFFRGVGKSNTGTQADFHVNVW